MSLWKVCHNPMLEGIKSYQVLRKLREGEPMHSGNVEYAEGLYTRQEAESVASYLNETRSNDFTA